jgi:spermidine/putrescine transport system substrate-binding protein
MKKLLAAFILVLVVGCATTKIDWNSRIGQYTYDEAIAELGVPDRHAQLTDGSIVAEWLQLVKVFDSDSPKTPLLNGDVDLGVVWSGEAARLIQENKKFIYVLPREGWHPFVDLLAIPTTSKNPGLAHRFIDYVLRPEVSKLISDEFPYTNPNTAARKLLSAEQLANAASYPKLEKLKTFRDIGKAAAEIDRLVTELKSGR